MASITAVRITYMPATEADSGYTKTAAHFTAVCNHQGVSHVENGSNEEHVLYRLLEQITECTDCEAVLDSAEITRVNYPPEVLAREIEKEDRRKREKEEEERIATEKQTIADDFEAHKRDLLGDRTDISMYWDSWDQSVIVGSLGGRRIEGRWLYEFPSKKFAYGKKGINWVNVKKHINRAIDYLDQQQSLAARKAHTSEVMSLVLENCDIKHRHGFIPRTDDTVNISITVGLSEFGKVVEFLKSMKIID